MKKNKLICCIDFEMTDKYEPLEFGCVRLSWSGDIIDYWETMFCAEGKPLIHGQRFNKKGTKTIEQLWSQISYLLEENYLAAHNIGTDRSLLLKHFPFLNFEGSIDSLNIYRKLYNKQVDNFSLGELLNTFNLTDKLRKLNWNEHFFSHRALYDAGGCALLLARLLKDNKLKEIFNFPTQEELF